MTNDRSFEAMLRIATENAVSDELADFDAIDDSGVTFSEKTESKMSAVFKKSARPKVKKIVRRLLIAAIILIACAALIAMTVPHFSSIYDVWTTQYSNGYVAIRNDFCLEESSAAPEKILNRYEPTYKMNRFDKEVVTDTDEMYSVVYYYAGTDEVYLTYIQRVIDDSYIYISDEYEISSFTSFLTNIRNSLYLKVDTEFGETPITGFIWSDGNYTYELYGNQPIPERYDKMSDYLELVQ